MPSRTVIVGSRIGLHARPAARIAEAAGSVGSPVTIGMPGGAPVDAGSALLLMTLGAKYGDEVVVAGDDQASLDKVADLVAQDLDA